MSRIQHPGITDLQDYLNSNTEDVRRLIERECSVMLECRFCNSIYRDFAKFCWHKRSFCRGEAYDNVDCNVEKGSTIALKKTTSTQANLAKHVSRGIEVSVAPISREHMQGISDGVVRCRSLSPEPKRDLRDQETCDVVKARKHSEPRRSVQEGNSVAATPATVCESSAVKDVTAVARFPVPSVKQAYREYRRDGIAGAPILSIFGRGDSTFSKTIAFKNDLEPFSAGQFGSSNAAHRNPVISPRTTTPNPTDTSISLSRQGKQNLSGISDDTAESAPIVSKIGGPGKVTDIAMVPVYISCLQKQLFFLSLKQLNPTEPNGKHFCSQCNEVFPNLKEGRRHMVSHIRVIRLRCSLCGAGSFFSTDLRTHLMEGHCEQLHCAPEGVVNTNCTPCMTKEQNDMLFGFQADALLEWAHPAQPGRVVHTKGKIVSARSRIPYYPDPVIEERILHPRIFQNT